MLTKFESEYYTDDNDNQHISNKGYENHPATGNGKVSEAFADYDWFEYTHK